MLKYALAALLLSTLPAIAEESGQWRSMDSAPRDGTTVEIQNSYGVAPWYGIYHYGGKMRMPVCQNVAPCENPTFTDWDVGDKWASEDRPGSLLDAKDERYFKWRPYNASGPYVDPTAGEQFTNGYWLRAIGRR